MQITICDSQRNPICIGLIKTMTMDENGVTYTLHPLHVFNGKEPATYAK